MSEHAITPPGPRRRAAPPWRLWWAAGSLLLLLGTLALPAQLPYLLRIEHSTSDMRTAKLSPQLSGPHPAVALVTITDATFPALDFPRGSPTNRAMLAELLRRLDRVGACAIGVDIFFLSPTPNDEILVKTVRSMRTPVILGAIDGRTQQTSDQTRFQKDYLARLGKPAGFITLRHEVEDNAVRIFSNPEPNSAYPGSLSLLLARFARPDAGEPYGRRIAWLRDPDKGPTFHTVRAQDLPPVAGPPPEQRPAPRCGTAEGASTATLANKIVLLGVDYPFIDRHRTPFSPWLEQLHSGLYIHAQMTADIVDGDRRAIRELSLRDTFLLQLGLAVAGLVLGWLFSANTASHMLGFTAGTAGLLLVGLICFMVWHLVLPFGVALATWVFAVTAGRSLKPSLAWLRQRKAHP